MSGSNTNHIQGFDSGDGLIFTQTSTKPMVQGEAMIWERRHDPEEYVSIIAEVFYDPPAARIVFDQQADSPLPKT
ncbi:hypothetical protein [Pseudomonas brassicacearum]|uniref:hypothetical protein n=1 Tax=Pseudomonas brassicacearum TaxID=930166 RepID=UPI003CE8B53E